MKITPDKLLLLAGLIGFCLFAAGIAWPWLLGGSLAAFAAAFLL